MFEVINGYKKENEARIKQKLEIKKNAYKRMYNFNKTRNIYKCIWSGIKYFARFNYNITDYNMNNNLANKNLLLIDNNQNDFNNLQQKIKKTIIKI